MEKRMVVNTVDGEEYTITGDIVEDVKGYFKTGQSVPLGWVLVGNRGINFNHVISIEFQE